MRKSHFFRSGKIPLSEPFRRQSLRLSVGDPDQADFLAASPLVACQTLRAITVASNRAELSVPTVRRATAELGPLSTILLARRPKAGRILILRIELRNATMTVRTGRLESAFQIAVAVFSSVGTLKHKRASAIRLCDSHWACVA
jgi:hypothetical protein